MTITTGRGNCVAGMRKAITSAHGVTMPLMLAAFRSDPVAFAAGVTRDRWASTTSPRVYDDISGYRGSRHRGRLPFVEIEQSAETYDQRASDLGMHPRQWAVRIHVGGLDETVAEQRARNIFGAALSVLRTYGNTWLGDSQGGEFTKDPLGYVLAATIGTRNTYGPENHDTETTASTAHHASAAMSGTGGQSVEGVGEVSGPPNTAIAVENGSLQGPYGFPGSPEGEYDMALMLWCNPVALVLYANLFSANIQGTDNLTAYIYTGEPPDFGAFVNFEDIISYGTPEADTWHHLAFTYNKTENLWRLYIDGVLAGTSSRDIADIAASQVYLGYNTAGFNCAFTSFKWGAVYLSAAEVAAEMATREAIKAGLVAYNLTGPSDIDGFTVLGDTPILTTVAGPSQLD